jgi:hypothetical protein
MTEPGLDGFYKFPKFDWPHIRPKTSRRTKHFSFQILHLSTPYSVTQYGWTVHSSPVSERVIPGTWKSQRKTIHSKFHLQFKCNIYFKYLVCLRVEYFGFIYRQSYFRSLWRWVCEIYQQLTVYSSLVWSFRRFIYGRTRLERHRLKQHLACSTGYPEVPINTSLLTITLCHWFKNDIVLLEQKICKLSSTL